MSTDPSKPTEALDQGLQVQSWPDRKRKVLSKVDGNQSTILATFVSDDAAACFLCEINDRLRAAYQMGKMAAIKGVSQA